MDMRNWYNNGAVHDKYIVPVRIQYQGYEESPRQHGMTQHNIGDRVTINFHRSLDNATNWHEGKIISIRFGYRNISYDVGVKLSSGVMIVLKEISGDSIENLEQRIDIPLKEIQESERDPNAQTGTAEELSPVASELPDIESYFNGQSLTALPESHFIRIKSLKYSQNNTFSESICKFQIGSHVKVIDTNIYGTVVTILANQNFLYSIATPTKDGHFAVYKDIDSDFLTACEIPPLRLS